MADIVRKIDYFKAEVPDRIGEGARVLTVLEDAGVNLLAFTGFPRGRKAQLDFVPDEPGAFRKAAKKAGLSLSKKTAFLVQGEDRPGAVAGIVSALADAGIGITALDAIAAGSGRYGAILWVKSADVRKASKILGAS